MKKTMFITSVIMVVVMAIALTTSSLAWFSAAGSPSVSTNSLKIEAKSTASQGLQIGKTSDGPWYDTVSLVSAGGNNMIPADLVLNSSTTAMAGYTSSDYDGTKAITTALDALVAESFISNSIDSNGLFEGTAQTANDTTNGKILYYTDTVFISSVDTANNKNVQASINWKVMSTGENPTLTVYSMGTDDPILYVAVLAAKEDSVTPDRSTAAAYRDWEILAIFNSGAQSTVRLGNDAESYGNGATVASRGETPTIANLERTNQTTSTPLGHITTNSSGAIQAYGSSREFKIIAWYDGASLRNANSDFELYFDLTFTAVN